MNDRGNFRQFCVYDDGGRDFSPVIVILNSLSRGN